MKYYLPLLLLLLPAFLPATTAGAEAQVYRCHLLSQEPVLDGNLDEPAWNGVPEGAGFIKLGGDSLAAKQTCFRMGYTPEALFIGIRCADSAIDKIKAALADTEDLWSEDSVEIFLFQKGADNYLQFVVNAIGSRWNGIGLGGPKMPLADWSAKAYRGKDYWSVEIKMPWEIFLAIPEKGAEWSGNVCRNIYTSGDSYSCWAHLNTGFHEPENFGRIIFEDEISSAAGKATKNRVMHLIREKIRVNLDPGLASERDFTKAGKEHPALRPELTDFLKDYAKIKKAVSQLDVLSVSEAVALLSESAKLSVWSDTLRGKVLKERLFD